MTTPRISPFFAGLTLVVLLHPSRSPAQAPGSTPPQTSAPQILDAKDGKIRVVPVATGLFHPWSLAFADSHTLLVAERNGRLRVIRDGVLLPEPAWTSPTPPDEGADALHFIAIHPKFAQNQFVYLSYPKMDGKRSTLAVARGRLSGAKLTDVQEIFVADAWETGGNLAGRVLVTPDGSLYVTVGDRDRLCCGGTDDNSLRMKAQSLDNHVGKTLKLRDDGTVPPDNPFVGRAGAKPEIFTYGHRNGYGLAVNPETGELWQAEIGPMGGDEVNILLPGHNYGWPLVSTGRNYTGTLVSDQPWARPGMDNPRIHWVPSISPSSIIFYTGDKFPKWTNNLFVGSLTQQQLIRIAFHQPSQAEQREGLLAPLQQRVRDVVQGPDGYIYVATEKTFRDNAADGAVLRIEPADQPN
jgi:glucose/arabinose dehydrogenase